MDRGKIICKTLKELRKRIADANGIRYEMEECPHTGPCPGTCPRCEQELEDLLDQLHWLEQEGAKLNLRNLMSEEELRMLWTGSPNQVEETDPFETAGIPARTEEDSNVLQGYVCAPPEGDMGSITRYLGNTPLAMGVMEQLLKLNDGGNLIFSPIGIQKALEMLQQGMDADSPIHDEVQDILCCLDSNIPECPTDDFTLEQATSLWANKAKGEVKETYIKILEAEFDASVFNRDFRDAASVKSDIDAWVNEKTHQAIKSLDLQLSPAGFMVLLDAIYMKAKWGMPFDAADTIVKPFHNMDGSSSNVSMMRQTLSGIAYEETAEYKSISLPYADGRHSMVIVLPHARADFNEVMASEDWMYSSESDGEVELSLPKFKFDVKVKLMEMLKDLGLGAMFYRADSFPKISEQPTHVSQFFQQCTIVVDEKGTEAAAVTVVECVDGSRPPIYESRKKYRMNVDRPFGFAVKYDDGQTDRILFAGVVKQLGNEEEEAPGNDSDNKRLSSITVAGTSHVKNIEELSGCIEEGTQLRLEHDKGNRYDRYAVALYLGDERVGFVPKGENQMIANLLDAGTRLVAIVTHVEWLNGWLRINADIEMVSPRQNHLTFSVEPAKMEDAECITQFQLDMAQESEGTVLDRETVLRGVKEGLNDPNKGFYLVARKDDGETIASLMITKEWSDWHCEWYWWIQSVYVKPECRRQGVYRKMYETVKTMAKESQVTSLRLYVDKTNSRGLATYHALGMKKSHYLLYEDNLE